MRLLRPPRALGEGPRRISHVVATAMPLGVPVSMRVLFPFLVRRLGLPRGYVAGFSAYWTVCLALPIATLGPRETARLLTARPEPLARAWWLGATILTAPLAGAVATELVPALRHATRREILMAPLVATANATAEELLWHGLPVAVYAGKPLRGWLLPAAGFTAWHLAPLSVRPARRPAAFLSGAAAIGLGYGWVAWRSRSLRSTLPFHVAIDACGLRAMRLWLDHA